MNSRLLSESPVAADLLRAELKWLDLLIHREILRLRATYQLSLDEFRGLYISDEQVDALVRGTNAGGMDLRQLDLAAEQARVNRGIDRSAKSPFALLSREFGLSPLEQDIVLVVLAPEIEPKYEMLYAYLNNDVGKKTPTLDLIARLLSHDERSKLDVRAALTCDAALLGQGLLRWLASSERHASTNAGLALHGSLPDFLLGLGFHDHSGACELQSRTELAAQREAIDQAMRSRLQRTARAWARGAGVAPIWILHGRDEALRRNAATSLCQMLDLNMLTFDVTALPRRHEDFAAALHDALLRQRLIDAGLRLVGIDKFHDGEGKLAEALAAVRNLRQARRPVFIDCESAGELAQLLRDTHVISIGVPELERRGRSVAWHRALATHRVAASPQAIEAVANGFALTSEQIRRAAQAVADEHSDEDPPEISAAQLATAARAHSDQSIARIAQRLDLPFEWNDLVLPPVTIRRLRDIVHAIRDRHLVFGDWGFSRRSGGFGLRILFAGPSGTGKTMAAATIAHELGVDIYRIDISQTVSKYIGETEKNLDKIFHAATHANAILFFDEADALFGKRSEVKDAHDRYSNIETAYLLQKLEEYQGVVFLASNLSRNIDSAFSRRLNFVVDFPPPDKQDRERLWRLMLASGAPVSNDVDIAFLAAQFPLTGGDIRNVTLDAAFLAARSDERSVTMKSLIVALGRQVTKQGRAPSAAEFKQHHELLT
jgi:SpoVK/Ycf46/Vps4 family AAA+-type ATPase